MSRTTAPSLLPMAALKDSDGDVRHYTADALLPFATADISTSEVAARRMEAASDALEKAFQRKDDPAIIGGVECLIGKGEDGTEPTLISAPRAHGTKAKAKAETCFNCGNTKLEAAAGQWAQDHGYTIQAQQVRYPTVMWGSNRQESTGHGESPSETFTVILLAYGCDRP